MNQTFKATFSQYALPQFLPTWGGKGGVIWEDLEVCSLKTMMFEKYPSISPYTYCANNPMKFVDPTGMELNPIFDYEGTFLGTDDKGIQGEAIIMKNEDFKQGMSHDEAMQKGTTRSNLPKIINPNILDRIDNKVASFPSRPDWDGIVTRKEGIDWAKKHPNALTNPSAENTLYLDASKLDFGMTAVSDFKNGVGKSSPINLFNLNNVDMTKGNPALFATIYALGTVDVFLHDANGTVSIMNNTPTIDHGTNYDWNLGGGFIRNTCIKAERKISKLNDSHGFKTYYYGKGKLNY